MNTYKIGNRLIRASSPEAAVKANDLPPAYTQWALEAVQIAPAHLFRKGWHSGTTKSNFARLGAHGGINVRAGEMWRNDTSDLEETERRRDAQKMRDLKNSRVSVHQWNSKWFRKRFAHLLSSREDF